MQLTGPNVINVTKKGLQ